MNALTEISQSKVQEDLVVMQLNIRKTFDTLLYEESIHKQYSQWPRYVNSYTIRYVNYPSLSPIRSKAGDPLSSCFNIFIEPLLFALEKQPGYKINNEE